MSALENRVDVDAWRVDLIGRQVARLDEMFEFGNDVIGGGGHHGIEVARGLVKDEVAPAVTLAGLNEGEIAAQGALKDEMAAVEFTGFFPFPNHRAVAGGRVERRNPRAARAQA